MLIIDMPMPKCCWDCACCDGEYGYCAARKKPFDDPNERPSWCPIKGVLPDEHGDLIDRDELKEKKIYSHERHEYVVPVAFIDWEHAVIEAERKDDEQIH